MRPHKRTGTVYLVGAGPGDPELITVKGLRALRHADAVIYDRLVHPSLLDEAPARAERIYAGKAPGRHSIDQEAIHALMIDLARRYGRVVRLKGGDPFVFGRGGEEAAALREAGVPYVVVPGISSAIAAPAYAGIPVTHRSLTRGFTVVTGHTCKPGDGPDWAALAKAGTLVVLMGLGRIAEISSMLINNGVSPDLPAVIVCQAATARQETVRGTLASIPSLASHLHPPATIVIGEVARLSDSLSWFETPVEPVADAFHPPFSEHIVALSA